VDAGLGAERHRFCENFWRRRPGDPEYANPVKRDVPTTSHCTCQHQPIGTRNDREGEALMTDTPADDEPEPEPLPTRYAYHYDGALITGTLADYAHTWAVSQYNGLHVSGTIVSWEVGEDPVTHGVRVLLIHKDENGDMRYEITALGNGEKTYITVDGRA
jgi:hypothetical protein